MKRLIILLTSLFIAIAIIAQAPSKINYQAVVRDASGKLVVNKTVGMRVSILQGSATGPSVYTETQTPATDANGLVNIEIGSVAPITGIDWADGAWFLKTETDPTGGANYTIAGTSQILSVPFAMYANKAGNGFSGNYTDLANKPTLATVATSGSYNDLTNKPTIPSAADGSETKLTAGTNVTITGSGTQAGPYVINFSGSGSQRYLGEIYNGGIIFFIYTGSDGAQHGLIVSSTESSSAAYSSTSAWVYATRPDDGAYNTSLMINSTAKSWVTGLGAGWYLPSVDELLILHNNRYVVNKTIGITGSGTYIFYGVHWSSTESTSANALTINFYTGAISTETKSTSYRVRAIKAF